MPGATDALFCRGPRVARGSVEKLAKEIRLASIETLGHGYLKDVRGFP
jgi:hypothetical protein